MIDQISECAVTLWCLYFELIFANLADRPLSSGQKTVESPRQFGRVQLWLIAVWDSNELRYRRRLPAAHNAFADGHGW
jgi:hypothetical protein